MKNGKFDFRLTPAYCIYNKVAVVEQHGAEIIFIVENLDNLVLRKRLENAFSDYLKEICNESGCPENYKKKMKVSFLEGSQEEIRRHISRLYQVYQADANQNVNADNLEIADEKFDSMGEKVVKAEGDAAAVILLDSIISEARKRHASDIHIEKNAVRFRINGLLEDYSQLDSDKTNELIGRIKILAGMNVIEKRKSQDGRFSYGENFPVFIRVSTVPVFSSRFESCESVVMRLLDTRNLPLKLDALGFNDNQLEKIRNLENEKNGLVLVCGATGSGKSTTIASVLSEIQKKGDRKLKIISLEDPPEYLIDGVCQIQIDSKNNHSYEDALNHIFRQDPDVIVIGEIRDELSAAAALKASLTGHLVFATLHCGSVGESLLRLENLNLNRNLVCSVLRGVICQSLSFKDKKRTLYADVSFPCENFAEKMKPYFSETQIDKLFLHFTNFSDILGETLNYMRSRYSEEMGKDDKAKQEFYENMMKHKIFLGGGYNAKRIRKRIG